MGKKQIIGIGVLIVMVAIYAGVKIYASSIAAEKVDKAIVKVSDYADIDYKKVSAELLGMDVKISGVTISPVNSKDIFTIDEIVIREIKGNGDIPTALSAACNGIELDPDKLEDDTEELKELGYEKITANLNIDYSYNSEKKEIDIQEINIDADNMAEITARFQLSNIAVEAINPKELISLLFTLPQVLFHSAEIRYDDDSLVKRLLEYDARKKGLSSKEYKEALFTAIDKAIAEEEDKLLQDFLKEVKKFLEDPKELSISMIPEKPCPVARIIRAGKAKKIIKLLNIQIKS